MKSLRRCMLVLTLALLVAGLSVMPFGCSPADKYNALRIENEQNQQQLQIAQGAAAPNNPSVNVVQRTIGAHDVVFDSSAELWIIERRGDPNVAPNENTPGAGALLANDTGHDQPAEKLIPVPLQHTTVKASIAGAVAAVDVTQQYQNPFSIKIEATYVFPLPHDAAVNEFIMTVGTRKIRGIIRERAEAERIYREARSQGYVASLLTQERPNIFTQKVGNIEPGKRIDINIHYFHTLSCHDGWFEFVFPMVVGPRFNPPGSSDGVGAVGRASRGVSGQSTEVQYLRPGERSGHDIALSVDLETPMPVQDVVCRSHQVQIQRPGATRATVALADSDRIPNKDFVLRYRLADSQIRSGALAVRDARGGYFTIMLVPPPSISELRRGPVEMVFTIDTSGSQAGEPLKQAKSAVVQALQMMNPGDTFQVINFNDRASKRFDAPVPATPENVRTATRWVESLRAGGGTMLVEGLRASLLFPHDESRLRYVVFLTDGFIGNEADALREIANDLGPARIFSFGVGSSVNRYLLEHMARLGNGAAAYLALNDDAGELMAGFFERISHPAMTDVSIEFGDNRVRDIYPRRLPDLIAGKAVLLSGRFSGELTHNIRVTGRVGGERQDILVPVSEAHGMAAGAIPLVWARTRLADLGDRLATGRGSSPAEIRSTALEYGLMSAYTSFIAVDASRRTDGDSGVSTGVPVEVPDGVKYDTTVEEKR